MPTQKGLTLSNLLSCLKAMSVFHVPSSVTCHYAGLGFGDAAIYLRFVYFTDSLDLDKK